MRCKYGRVKSGPREGRCRRRRARGRSDLSAFAPGTHHWVLFGAAARAIGAAIAFGLLLLDR